MAKTSQINRNKKREKLVAQYAAKRAELKGIAEDMKVAGRRPLCRASEAGQAAAQFFQGPHSSPLRASGRPKGYYRKVKMSRIALRSLSISARSPA